MIQVFLSVLNMSLTASYVIAAVMLARLFLKKAPKIISYLLWSVVGFRLLVPFSFESVFSLIPFQSAPIPADITMQPTPRINSGVHVVDNAVSSALPAAEAAADVNPMQAWLTVGVYIWLAGVAAMLIYSVISIILLKRRLAGAVLVRDNIYRADNIRTPFVLGFFRPDIFIPAGLKEEEKSYIILHEQTHIRRRDPIVKLVGYFALCLHWFNPLAWAAFLLMGADMEMSCDERVLKQMGSETKKSYSLSLLSLAAERRMIGGSPLAFGEGGMKERIKNILNFRKASRMVVAVALAAAAILSAGFVMNQPQEPAGLLIRADVNEDGQKEALCLDTSRQKSGFVTLRVYGGSGKEIWNKDVLTAHPGWNSIFLYEEAGKCYLLRYTPAMEQGGGTYSYSLFTLNDNGSEHIVRSNQIEFNIYEPNRLDTDKMVSFAEEINTLLGKSTLLLSSEGGEYSFGPSSAGRLFEKYSWLDSRPELYANGDDLKTRLIKYSEHAISNDQNASTVSQVPAGSPGTSAAVKTPLSSRIPQKPEDVLSVIADALTNKHYDTYVSLAKWRADDGSEQVIKKSQEEHSGMYNLKKLKLVKYKEIDPDDVNYSVRVDLIPKEYTDIHVYAVAYDCEVYKPTDFFFNGRNYFICGVGKDGKSYKLLAFRKPAMVVRKPNAFFGDKEENIQAFIEDEYRKGYLIDADGTLVGLRNGKSTDTVVYKETNGLTVEEYLKSIGKW